MRSVAISSLITGGIVLLIYIGLLIVNNYINPTHDFSLDNAAKIAPFVGSCVGVFFSLAGTLLIFENLRLTNQNNERNQILTQKNQFESVYFNMLTQQRQIRDAIDTTVEISGEEESTSTKGTNFFDDLCSAITIDFRKLEMTKENLLLTYKNQYIQHNSDLGHYFRHMYNIVKFVHRNPYFTMIEGNANFYQREDYIKILRAQLTNSELVLLSLNALTPVGTKFKPLMDTYQLLKNINFELTLQNKEGYYCRVPSPELIVAEYPYLSPLLEAQKNESSNS